VTSQNVNPIVEDELITLSRWIIKVFMSTKSHIDTLLGETEFYK
jgi:hypothetical protein